MATLEIRKIEENLFKHIPSDNLNWFVSSFYCKTDGDYFQVVENSGSKRGEFHYSDVTVYDIGGSVETFSSSQDLMQRLKELGYTGFFREGEVSPSLLSGFVKKDYAKIQVDSVSTGVNAVVPLPTYGKSTIELTNASLVSVAGFLLETSEDIYDGKEYDIHNLTGNPITILNNNSFIVFLSKNGNDLEIPNNEILKVKYSTTESAVLEWFRSWGGGGGASNLIHYKIHWYNQTQITGSGTIDFFDGFLAIPANTLQADDKIIIRTHFGDMDDSTTSFLSHHVFSDQIRPVYDSNGLIGIGSTNRRIGGFSREIRVVSDSETKQHNPGSSVFSDFYFNGFAASYNTQNGVFFQNLFNDDTYCNLYINCPNTRKYNVIFTEIYVYRNN